MGKNYFCSNLDERERQFLGMGQGILGESNLITTFFKIVGKFSELNQTSDVSEILNYQPDLDRHFKYENMGYTVIKEIYSRKYPEHKMARKFFKNLSRKWMLTPIILHHESDCIIEVLIQYILSDENLKASCKSYFEKCNSGSEWMPIQYQFFSTRDTDPEKRDWRKAVAIMERITALYNDVMR